MGPGGQQPLTDCQNSSSPHFFSLAASVDATVRRRILVPLAWQVFSFFVSSFWRLFIHRGGVVALPSFAFLYWSVV